MKLKKLILHGFKSFAERTEFEFEDGITVIVGPNGCGKSNVVDAVKWVLGEQRPSSLRGKEMQDVIFSGTDQRKGVGFAEVSLVLDNSAQTLPIDYEEVAITRRLYRSGESEYLINGNAARLRDIRELMMDSGGGPGALTVMEQGNIDRLLRADGQERRLVFEEAAGIAKYRSRRKETERKLARTNDNLARLRDILGEYETRQRSLKIQAGKARRFREMTEELKRKRLAGALARYADLNQRRSGIQSELDEIARLEGEARTTLDTLVSSSEEQRRELEARRERVATTEAEMAALVGEGRAETEKRLARTREAAELLERSERAVEESRDAERRAVEQRESLEEARRIGEEARAENARRAEALEEAAALFAEVEGRVAVLRRGREELDSRRAGIFAEETAARNAEVGSEAEIRTLRRRVDRIEERAVSAGAELKTLEAERDRSDLSLKSAEEALRALEDRYTAAEQGGREARAESDEAAQVESRAAGEARALGARREVLERLAKNGEGLSAGTRALLDEAPDGLRGTVADLVGDAGAEARALDLALGELAAALVFDTTAHALAALAWLDEGERGRARVVPLDRLTRGAVPERFAGIHDELIGGLLQGTRVSATLPEALAEPRGFRVVALSGEELEPLGPLVGGTGDAGAGLVERQAELADLRAKIAATETERAGAAEALRAARQRAAEWEHTLEELRPRLQTARDELRVASESLAGALQAASARAEEMDLERAERADVERVIADCETTRDAARQRRLATEEARAALDAEANGLAERLAAAASDREAAEARRTEAKVDAARWAEKVEAAALRTRALEEGIAAAEREAKSRADEAAGCRERRAACLDEIQVIDRLAAEREKRLAVLGKEVETLRAAAREVHEQLAAGDRRVKELRDVHERRREELERHRMREQELRLRIETLLEEVRRDHALELDRVEPDEELEGADPELLEREVAELREKLERLGNVNHAALEELAEVEEKLDFMRREETDLVSAEKQLRETIERIDEVCTTRFSETFEKVRENFHLVFRKLFGGGRAEVFLEDPEDLLGSGVEIRVRPPGKELRNLALLSGGEKSLTTVALLFSIYQTKPPPFCLLDEVDAALDEANTIRMCEMLKDFALRGQFLVITHARPTMTVADTLYGVTMPEAGVSRRVAVRFDDIEAGRVVGLN